MPQKLPLLQLCNFYLSSVEVIDMEKTLKVAAVVVAAGNSTRMGYGMSKQLIPLLGIPTIGHTLMAFEEASCINQIVVVCRESDIERINEIAAEYNISKLKAVVTGGDTRSESVRNGVSATDEDIDFVAIHDGARPLVTPQAIGRVVSAAVEKRAAALAVPVTDTIKVVDENGFIVSTPLRSTLRAAQTPQVFEKALYTEALDKTRDAGVEFTDDCALVEWAGVPVMTVMGDYSNIKLTTPGDVSVAENILRQRGEK